MYDIRTKNNCLHDTTARKGKGQMRLSHSSSSASCMDSSTWDQGAVLILPLVSREMEGMGYNYKLLLLPFFHSLLTKGRVIARKHLLSPFFTLHLLELLLWYNGLAESRSAMVGACLGAEVYLRVWTNFVCKLMLFTRLSATVLPLLIGSIPRRQVENKILTDTPPKTDLQDVKSNLHRIK